MIAGSRDTLVALLVSDYARLTRRLAARLGSVDLANEALQDTYVRLSRTEITGELHNPRAYLARMAINIARNRARSEVRHLSSAQVDALLDLPDESPDPARIAEARSELAVVERALDAMQPRRRAMFRHFWVNDASHRDIADHFGLSERTVRHELLQATRYLHDATRHSYAAVQSSSMPRSCPADLPDRRAEVSCS